MSQVSRTKRQRVGDGGFWTLSSVGSFVNLHHVRRGLRAGFPNQMPLFYTLILTPPEVIFKTVSHNTELSSFKFMIFLPQPPRAGITDLTMNPDLVALSLSHL